MQIKSVLFEKLDNLQKIYPIKGIVHVGFGEANASQSYKKWKVEHALFIEADKNLSIKLNEQLSNLENWDSLNVVIAGKEELCQFYYASNPKENSLLPSSSLSQFWRNLKTKHVEDVQSKTLANVINCRHNAEHFNWVVVDCLPAGEILASLAESIYQYDVISARVILNSDNLVPEFKNTLVTKSKLDDFLSNEGFACIGSEESSHPSIGTAIYHRNWKKSFFTQQSEYEKRYKLEKIKFDTVTDELASLHKSSQLTIEAVHSLENITTQLTLEKSELEEQCNALKNERQILNSKVDALQLQVSRTESLMKQLELQNVSLTSNEKRLIEHSALIDKMTYSQEKLIQSLEQNMGQQLNRGFNNSVKQIESFISVQNYLETGSVGLDYHGWPISSDIAMFLIKKIAQNKYDLIIEFGSGTSTLLFAKSLLNKVIREQKNTLPKMKKSTVVNKKQSLSDNELVVSGFDLSSRVVTFEHNKKYFQQTLQALKEQGLDQVVNLLHTPLINYQVEEDNYLFYSCLEQLNKIQQKFTGSTAKILVLIDGPPAITGPLARLPAMSLLLNHLSNHQLDLVLDDYNRNEEKEIVKKWKKMLEKRFISYQEELVQCEKGAFFCRINP